MSREEGLRRLNRARRSLGKERSNERLRILMSGRRLRSRGTGLHAAVIFQNGGGVVESIGGGVWRREAM